MTNKKMQSEMADFATSAATWRIQTMLSNDRLVLTSGKLNEIYASSLILAHLLYYVKT